MSTEDAHLSIDQLADFGADAMPQAEATGAHAHLRTCEDCRATSDLLGGMPALLASAAHVPIPADVTARVVAAIEREQIARGGARHEAPVAAASSTRTTRVGARRRFTARLGAGLLGAAAVLGGGYLVASDLLGGGSDEPSAGVAEDAAQAPTAGAMSGAEPAPGAARTDGLAYAPATFDEDIKRLVALTPTFAGTSRTPGQTVEDGGELDEADAIATETKACVAATQRQAGTANDPVAIDIGTYDGVSAVVIVLPGGAVTITASTFDVWVVGTNCVGKTDAQFQTLLGALEVLRHESVRP